MYREDWVKPGRMIDREMAMRMALTMLRVASNSGNWKAPEAVWAFDHFTEEVRRALVWNSKYEDATGMSFYECCATWVMLPKAHLNAYFPNRFDFVNDVRRTFHAIVRDFESYLKEQVEIYENEQKVSLNRSVRQKVKESVSKSVWWTR